MKLHEREPIVREAEIKFLNLLSNFKKENDITEIEYLQLLESEISSVLKYMLRYERHGNYKTPGGISG